MRWFPLFLFVSLILAGSVSADEITPTHSIEFAPVPIPIPTDGCWTEPPPVWGGTSMSSMKIDVLEFESEVANDFVFDHDTELIAARWWAGIW